jgi:hypothetical protein
MEYSIMPENTGKYILIQIKGNIERQETMQLVMEAYELGKELGILYYLVDVREVPHSWSVMDDYTFVNKELQDSDTIRKSRPFTRTALLISPNDTSYAFFITAARNRGLNIRLFDDREKGVAFLVRT